MTTRKVRVKAHDREVGDEVVHVDAYEREVEVGPEDSAGVVAEQDATTGSVRARQQQLWLKWDQAGRPNAMLPELMAAFAPTVAYRKSVYAKNVRIPEDAIELQLQMQLVKALRTYDPTKGASVNTHVVNYLHGVQRWIGENQNIGRIPENRIYKIRPYKNALVELTEELVRQPTDTEVAERLGWDVKEVERMRKELRSDLYTQGFDNDPASYTPSKRLELLHMFVSELEGEERVLYEYLTGINRERVESTNELARLLGKEPYKISRMKERIAKRLEVHLADLDTEEISAEDDDDDE